MSALPRRIEADPGLPPTPSEIFAVTSARETSLSRLLTVYITTGLIFMLLPGTFLGVWNLLAISSHRAANSVSAGWIQAHGHAQIFGWIGTFILGIGFYSIPKLRRTGPLALSAGWITWALWTSGVSLRWLASVYGWHWRAALPISATLELSAFLIFFRSVSGHRPQDSGKNRLEEWVVAVIAGTVGLLLTLAVNLASAVSLALYGKSPDLPHSFDQRFLVLQTWGFLVPFVWGFSAKWLPVFLGLRPTRGRAILGSLALNSAGTLAALHGWIASAAFLLVGGMVLAVYALRLFESAERPAKTRGVHASFPVFIRLAYFWGIVSALLAIWATWSGNPLGIWGASRHALTVGFLATMVFAVGQRVLPAFSGRHLLFSTKFMVAALLLLAIGCLLRVASEILAYQGVVQSAWSWLPVSAVTEMAAVTVFAANLLMTFAGRPHFTPA
ncbi:MAG: NnrS family protein [Terriglobia bacterium]